MSSVVPDGWSRCSITDICNVVGGGTPERIKSEYWSGNIYWASPTEITKLKTRYISKTKESITTLGLDNSSAKLHPVGTVLMTSRASIGYVAINTMPMATNQGFQSLQCKSDVINEFLYQYITWIRPELEKLSAGSTFSEISSTNMKKVKVVIPSLLEQQKIAAILTSADEVIEKTQAQIDKFKDLKTGMMQELLTKGIGHTEFKDSPVGSIPVGWEVVKISDLCSEVVDCVNKTAPVVDYKTPYKMIRTTNVRHGRVDTENVRYVAQETYETWTRRMRPENGDLIFTREAPVGECGVLEDSRGVFLGQRTMMYRANEQLTSSRFLMYSLMSNYGKQQLDDFSGGSTVAHMRVPDCNKILIKTPPIEEQNKIVNSIHSIDVSIQKKESKLEKTMNTKKALMQDLLTGKVRVNTAQATPEVAVG